MKLNEKSFAMAMVHSGFLTLAELSRQSGVSKQTISLARSGKKIKPETAAKLAIALNVDLCEIVEN